MSERKVINKYYPPDFDPLKAERDLKKANKSLKKRNNGVVTVRLMTPFSIRCLKCDEYIPQSKKFNGKKEILDEKYLDTFKMYRLNIRCPRCSNCIAFRTDPQSADYVMEFGGTRNYAGRLKENKNVETADQALERLVKEHDDDRHRGEDKMQALEERLSKLQREQEGDQQLVALKNSRAQQQRKVDSLSHESEEDQDDELDKLAERAFESRKGRADTLKVSKPAKKIRRATGAHTGAPNPLGIRIKR
ncbi:hypothetical protein ZYGR_0E00450 [Zygosaccharomyces rouxii]|uniref:ZYRO0B01078p n=2 Tax=Zygosaccharomyces rouxii TaxID=4956 RepID=C5DQK5_ZYGRC|nr:uncharacterized protein ZYRO0B01078g [Zygosaccharomyces rouxii]KAH9200382.1 CWC16 protein [Zygosaccharomyces rouxii]GAV47034.1 hypothetical protein ZYGR_0E00450 [Zygosaccharomyces rouxii]CAR26066.1 ZYRO0B01078p [Zygosaccharomyces rouxii]